MPKNFISEFPNSVENPNQSSDYKFKALVQKADKLFGLSHQKENIREIKIREII